MYDSFIFKGSYFSVATRKVSSPDGQSIYLLQRSIHRAKNLLIKENEGSFSGIYINKFYSGSEMTRFRSSSHRRTCRHPTVKLLNKEYFLRILLEKLRRRIDMKIDASCSVTFLISNCNLVYEKELNSHRLLEF